MLHSSESKTDSMLLNTDVDYKTKRKCPNKCSKKCLCCSITMLWVATSLVTFALGYHIKAKECLRDGSFTEEL